jgi:uncharacterized protein YndB with AHSA1/START domain
MRKQRLNLEYPLAARKPDLLWRLISTDHGMERWLADKVVEEDDNETMTFTWGHSWTERDTKQSRIIEIAKYDHIRLLWDYHEETPEAFWEMRIEESDVTGLLSLMITDFAADDDEETDLRGIWDDNLERLHRVSGL